MHRLFRELGEKAMMFLSPEQQERFIDEMNSQL